MGAWLGKDVAKYVSKDSEIKVNPNGIDVGVSEILKIPYDSIATLDGRIRTLLPNKIKVESQDGFYVLERGTYEIRIANEIEIPQNAVGMLLPRSTLNRLGIIKSETAVWDSGYKGYGTQTIYIPIKEFRVKADEKFFQLMFFDTKNIADMKYDGYYQSEKPQDDN